MRCCNIDWLEVYALEPIETPHNADYYRAAGLWVEERGYGTRIYKEMFTILDDSGHPLMEVRRNPKQADFGSSVIPINGCHVRLPNRLCYSKNAIGIMKSFLETYHLTFSRVYRIDICLDFEKFDTGDDPGVFLYRYIKGKFSKINQADIAPRGKDRWDGRVWNYVHWGSQKSPISTKFYNKSLELKEVHDKPYIRQAWFNCGLVSHPVELYKSLPDGTRYTPVIWRVEFSIRSSVKNWVTFEADGNEKKKRSVRNTLEMYDTEAKLIAMFATLQEHYFHFRHYHFNRLKWDCPRKHLFRFSTKETTYRVEHPSQATPALTAEERLLKYLRQYELKYTEPQLQKAVAVIRDSIEKEETRRLLSNPHSSLELQALQLTISRVSQFPTLDPAQVYCECLDELKNASDFY